MLLCYLISTSFILVKCLFSIVQLLLSLTTARTMTKQDHWFGFPGLLLLQFLNRIIHPLAFYIVFKILPHHSDLIKDYSKYSNGFPIPCANLSLFFVFFFFSNLANHKHNKSKPGPFFLDSLV